MTTTSMLLGQTPAHPTGYSTETICLTAHLTGDHATRALAGSTGGGVAAVFERCAYLKTARDALVCIGSADIGAGPLNVLVSLPPEVSSWQEILRVGQDCAFAIDRLRIGEQVVVNLRTAVPWQPPATQGRLELDLVARHLRLLRDAARRAAPAHGLGWVAAGHCASSPDSLPGRIAAQALPAVGRLHQWTLRAIAKRDGAAPSPLPSPPPQEVCALVGLGPGLTPSGDDLIGGLMMGLHAIGQPVAAQCLARWVLPLARRNSSPISTAHLAAAADGQGAEILHRLLVGLGRDPGWRAQDYIAALGGQGQSSGWDAVSGIWVAMHAWLLAAATGGPEVACRSRG